MSAKGANPGAERVLRRELNEALAECARRYRRFEDRAALVDARIATEAAARLLLRSWSRAYNPNDTLHELHKKLRDKPQLVPDDIAKLIQEIAPDANQAPHANDQTVDFAARLPGVVDAVLHVVTWIAVALRVRRTGLQRIFSPERRTLRRLRTLRSAHARRTGQPRWFRRAAATVLVLGTVALAAWAASGGASGLDRMTCSRSGSPTTSRRDAIPTRADDVPADVPGAGSYPDVRASRPVVSPIDARCVLTLDDLGVHRPRPFENYCRAADRFVPPAPIQITLTPVCECPGGELLMRTVEPNGAPGRWAIPLRAAQLTRCPSAETRAPVPRCPSGVNAAGGR